MKPPRNTSFKLKIDLIFYQLSFWGFVSSLLKEVQFIFFKITAKKNNKTKQEKLQKRWKDWSDDHLENNTKKQANRQIRMSKSHGSDMYLNKIWTSGQHPKRSLLPTIPSGNICWVKNFERCSVLISHTGVGGSNLARSSLVIQV